MQFFNLLLSFWVDGVTYAGEGTVVPQVALVGEAVTDEAELALLDVLLDGVKELLLGDLWRRRNQYCVLLRCGVDMPGHFPMVLTSMRGTG
jgi:hypothetical protein